MENMNNIDKKKQMKDLNDLIHGKKPSLLSNQEFEGFIEIYVDICYSGSRKGQAYMYALEQVRPEIYKDVVGCPSRDCFYEDKKILNLKEIESLPKVEVSKIIEELKMIKNQSVELRLIIQKLQQQLR